MSDLDRSMHRSLWVWVAHSSFIEGSHTTKNTASVPTFGTRREKSLKKYSMIMVSSSSTVVEPPPHHPMIKGLRTGAAADTRREEMVKMYTMIGSAVV